MPIEIRELQINVTVDNPQPQAGPAGNNAQGNTPEGDNRKALTEHCIEQTLAIINNKKER